MCNQLVLLFLVSLQTQLNHVLVVLTTWARAIGLDNQGRWNATYLPGASGSLA